VDFRSRPITPLLICCRYSSPDVACVLNLTPANSTVANLTLSLILGGIVHYENINSCLKESYPGEQNWYVVYIRTRDSLTLSLFQLISEVRLWNNLV
jgi:hypothetical protein